MLSTLGLERFRPSYRRILGRSKGIRHHTPPEHVRVALEELGTTFIKLGQILSTRADLLPPRYLDELARLQDSVPPLAFDELKGVVAEELGRPIDEAFTSFDPNPLAAGSIGQVHLAIMRGGVEVVVKIRRPGVVEQVEEDLEILQDLAAAAARRWELAEQYDVVGLAAEFADTLRAELDYIREGRNADHFARLFRNEPGIHIPRIFWEATTPQVITMERIKGIKVSELSALDAARIDRKELAHRASNMLLRMVFEDGFFHADPHPGNIFIEPDGRIGLIDFGMVGAIDEHTGEQLEELLQAVASQDTERLVDALLDMGVIRGVTSRELLQRDLRHLLSSYYGRPIGEVRVGQLLDDVFAMVRRHHMRLPSNTFLLLKTLVMSEGIGVQLDPSFNLTTALGPYARKLLLRRYSPAHWAHRLRRASEDMAWLGVELPSRLRRIVKSAERGDMEVRMRPVGLEPSMRQLERLANRLVIGVLAAAFINGLAVLLSVYRPFSDLPWVGVIFGLGFASVTVLGAYLLWSMLRSRR